MLRGRSFAAANDCARARTDWAVAANMLRSTEDSDGYRGKYLAELGRGCRT
jgi:hypothetical protein